MSNLLQLDPAFRVVLPYGASGGTGYIEYQMTYLVAAQVAGASSRIKVAADGSITTPSGSPVTLLGALLGDPEPPYVKLVVYPTLANGRGEPIIVEGRPHEYPTGSGRWDLKDIGGDDRPVVVSREQRASVQEVIDLLPDARKIPEVISSAEKAAADARALLEAQRGTLVYHLPGAAPPGMERFYTLDPANFQPSTIKVVVLGEEKTLDVIQAGM